MSRWLDRVETMKSLQRCVRCGKQDAYTMNGHQRCYECTEKSRIYQKKRNKIRAYEINEQHKTRYYKLKSEGVCVICGVKKARKGKILCEHCASKQRQYCQKYYRERSNNDSKTTCGRM